MQTTRLRRQAPPLLLAVAALLTLLTLLTLGAPPAHAHDTLIGSTPSDGDSVDAVPRTISLEFSGDVREIGAEVVIEGPDGEVQTGEVHVDGAQVHRDVSPQAGAGAYAVTWRVTSADGHPISGEFGFTVTEAAPAPPAPPTSEPSAAPTASEPADTPTGSGSASASANGGTSEPPASVGEASGLTDAEEGGLSPGLLIAIGAAVVVAGGAVIVLATRGRG